MNTFRITASAWAARTWTTGEAEVVRPARRHITIPPAGSRLRKAMSSRELQDRGSTWGRDGSSRARASAQNCCRHPRLWTVMTKVSRDKNSSADFQFDWNVSARTWRCKTTVFFRQSRGGWGNLPVPLGAGGGGGEEGEEHGADREDRPRGVWPLSRSDHWLCGKSQKELTDCEDYASPSYNIARLYLFAFVLVKCLYKIYL